MVNAPKVFCLLALAGFTSTLANAQVVSPATEKIFLNVNIAGQLAARTLNSTTPPITVFEEADTTLTAATRIGRGVMPDVEAGYRVYGDFYAALGVSYFFKNTDAAFTVAVPDPLFFGRAKTVTGAVTGLNRKEVAVNPHLVWATTLTDKVDMALGVGASLIHVNQEVIDGFAVPAEGVVTVTTGTESATAKGVYAQADFIYNWKPKYSFGVFARYAGGKADLPSALDQNAGGMMIGGGIRLHY